MVLLYYLGMNTSYSITTKYQVTIPKDIRAKIGLKQSDRVEFIEDSGKVYIKRVPTLEEVAAKMHKKFAASGRKPATDDEINNAHQEFIRKGGKW